MSSNVWIREKKKRGRRKKGIYDVVCFNIIDGGRSIDRVSLIITLLIIKAFWNEGMPATLSRWWVGSLL